MVKEATSPVLVTGPGTQTEPPDRAEDAPIVPPADPHTGCVGAASGTTPTPVASALEPASLLAVVERLVQDGFERVARALDEKHSLDRFREGQVDRLHAELQAYRADLVGRAVRPALQSMIRLHDDLSKVLEALAREDPAKVTPERLLKLLAGFHDDVELALDHNGVRTFRADVELFDPKRQKVLRTIETADAAQVGRVAARLRPGFEHGDAIIEKERVAVYVLAQPKPAQ